MSHSLFAGLMQTWLDDPDDISAEEIGWLISALEPFVSYYERERGVIYGFNAHDLEPLKRLSATG